MSSRHLRGRLSCALAVALVAPLLAFGMASRAAAAQPGVALPGPEATDAGTIRTLGTHWVRMFILWEDIESSPGTYSQMWLDRYDVAIRSLPAGSKVLLDVVHTPQWETGSTDVHTPPANPQDFATFVGALARHFGPLVDAYEIWNEEDAPIWWTGAPDPARYTQLLKASYPAIKAAEPAAKVVLGGLTGNDYEFVEGIYRAGGKGYFDAIGVHTDTACNKWSPYEFIRGGDGRLLPDDFLGYREVHAVELANGDDKPIWMTEMSWRTTHSICEDGHWAGQTAAGVSDEEQAKFLRQAFHCMAQDPYVQVALWFPLMDVGSAVSGLIRADGSRKPSFTAMRDVAHDGDTLKGPCGDFSGPKITVSSPSNHTSYSGPLPIHVSAKSASGVFRIRLEIDGKLIRNYDGPTYPTVLRGSIVWQGAKHISFGRHRLTFLAFDKKRNVSERTLTIVHRHASKKHRRRHHRRHG